MTVRHRLLVRCVLAVATMAATLAAAAPASALTIVHQTPAACSQAGSLTNWGPTTLALPRFDPSLGTLTNVTIIEKASMRSDFGLESTDNVAQAIELGFTGTVTLDVPTLEPRSIQLEGGRVVAFTAFDGTVDFGGTSGQSGVVGPDQSDAVRSPTDLAAWTGVGNVGATASATAIATAKAAGNYKLERSTHADVQVCVVYTYTETILVCIGDYVWHDADKDGIQDPGEAGLADRPIVVTDANGAQLGSTQTDADGRWKVCNLEPTTPCIVAVDLPPRWTVTEAAQGTDPSVDSNGVANGEDATIACATPPTGEDLTFDVGVYRARVPAPTEPRAPVTRITASKVANRSVVASGGTAVFTVTVSNRGTTVVRNVAVCDTPPEQFAFTTKPRGSFVRNGQLCWGVRALRPGARVTYRYTMRAANVAARSCVTNSVTAIGSTGSAGARDSVCIRATRLGVLRLAG